MSDLPGPGENEFDAVRSGTPENEDAAETGHPETGKHTAKLIRLPHRPRRVTEDAAEPRRKTWRSDSGPVLDPTPTKPVLRSELQRETGAWPLDLGPAWQHTPVSDPGRTEHDGSVIDFGAVRRKRAGNDASAAGIRRIAKPRRIGPDKP
ncbi:hypothetical protein [Nocardia arthritidis]|uniref:Uncharacterized protein n=1 Tax=Nocardia arthritidis TaxID=228602 RepID=A0A6G9YEG6_9NOCA|nr:hypothetical protein [Nocardia arthritidis]QIS11436.1 hypothetical protein F5544_17810 [Nocardia arthritidis]